MAANLKTWLVENEGMPADANNDVVRATLKSALEGGRLERRRLCQDDAWHDRQAEPEQSFGGAGDGIRVKRGSERYSTTKSVGKHVRTGLPVRNERGREVQTPSELEYAKAGTFQEHRLPLRHSSRSV